MTNVYEEYGTDTKAEREGVWIKFGDGLEIKLARAGGKNRKFAKVFEKKTRPHRRRLETMTAKEGLAEKLLIETFATTVVLDWKNITDKDGSPWPFSKANCIQLFTDLPDLFAEIREEAQRMDNFQNVQTEEDEKNSSPSCSTT